MAAQCGEWTNNENENCDCPSASNTLKFTSAGGEVPIWCCGDFYDGKCMDSKDIEIEIEKTTINIPEVSSETLKNFNPLDKYSNKAGQLSNPGEIISEILNFAFPLAGIILFLMILFGGLKMLTGATNESKLKEGQQMIVSAIVGFIILFAAYWIASLLEMVFGISILA